MIVAIAMGFLAGIGVGGGSLLVLWLTLVVHMEYAEARIINLMFFIPAALISSVFRIKGKTLNFKKILPAVIAGCLGAFGASLLNNVLDIAFLKKLFGGLLLITGVRELLYKPKKSPQ
jgi:uncharacterized membrane protein YfcA